MINPAEVKNYNRTESELEEFLLFCINVAGKKSAIECAKLETFLKELGLWHSKGMNEWFGESPFELIRAGLKGEYLMDCMKACKIAPYDQRYASYLDVVTIGPLKYAELTDLLKVRGIGLKTSRFFLSNTQEDFDEPMLDTHIMRYLRNLGHHDAPKTTPQNEKVYAKWAAVFSEKARQEQKSVRELDIQVWKEYSNTN